MLFNRPDVLPLVCHIARTLIALNTGYYLLTPCFVLHHHVVTLQFMLYQDCIANYIFSETEPLISMYFQGHITILTSDMFYFQSTLFYTAYFFCNPSRQTQASKSICCYCWLIFFILEYILETIIGYPRIHIYNIR